MTLSTLTPDERQLLASLPQAIGSAVALAGRSGLFGTGKELWAAGQAVLAGAKEYPNNALIRDIVPDVAATDRSAEMGEMRATRDWYAAHVKQAGVDSAEKMQALVLDDVRKAAALLDAKVAPAEAAEYRNWTLGVADKVAMASTEGGFLGFGGERLSQAERDVIAQIKGAFGVA